MKQLLRIGVRNLLQNRRRSLMLGGAIALVTLLLVMLLAISGGMQATMLRSANTLTTGHVNVAGFYKVTSTGSGPLVSGYPKLLELVRETVPEAKLVVPRARGWGKIISETSSLQAEVGGVDIAGEATFREVVRVEEGSLDGLAEPGTLLVFRKQAERLGLAVGDMVTISAPTFRGVNNTVDVRVVAIAADLGLLSQMVVFTPAQTVRKLYQLSDETTGALMITLHDRADAPAVQERLRKVIGEAGYTLMDVQAGQPYWMKFDTVNREDWTGQKIDVTRWDDEASFLKRMVDTFDVLAALLVGVLLVIIVVGIMNTLWMTIRERTSEIGTLRAIGMARSRVLSMFLIESFVLSASASLFGAAVGLGLALGLDGWGIPIGNESLQIFLMSDTLRLAIDLPTLARALVTVVAVTTLGALYPSWRAARMRPVTAIHTVG